jgi:GTP-binding protein
MAANEFWSMGFEDTFFVSSLTGSGTGDILDRITEFITDDEPLEETIPKFAILGRPNVGKSSLTNALLGTERNIVTDIAGTTRDSIHTKYKKFDKEFYLIDTAGIRKKAKVHENIEFYSVMRAIRALEESDVCIIMIDATLGVEQQDLNIFNLAKKRNKGIVILVNKWDLMEKSTNTARDMEKEIKNKLAPFNDVPVIFVSVLEKQRIFQVLEAAQAVYENRTRRISTSELNEVMLAAIERYAPPAARSRLIRIKFVTQIPTYFPAFAFFCNHPKHIKEAYKNYLENQLRSNFNFEGVPISVFFRQK